MQDSYKPTIVWNRSFMIGLPNMWCYLSPVVHTCLLWLRTSIKWGVKQCIIFIRLPEEPFWSMCEENVRPICFHTNECSAVWAHSMVIISLIDQVASDILFSIKAPQIHISVGKSCPYVTQHTAVPYPLVLVVNASKLVSSWWSQSNILQDHSTAEDIL